MSDAPHTPPPAGSPPRAWRQLLHRISNSYRLRFTSTCVETALFVHNPAPLFRFTSTCVETASRSKGRCAVHSVHLHVRGDSDHESSDCHFRYGSPPRAWRQLNLHALKRRHARFTSTCVETAAEACRAQALATVHLHVRGDSPFGLEDPLGDYGSPPRAWRQPVRRFLLDRGRRFTSTCVETACRNLPAPPLAPVHLHVRGDSV